MMIWEQITKSKNWVNVDIPNTMMLEDLQEI